MSEYMMVRVDFGTYESEDGDEHIPFMEVIIDEQEPIRFMADCAYETQEGARQVITMIDSVLKSGNEEMQ